MPKVKTSIQLHQFTESYFPPNMKIFGAAIGIFGLVMIYFNQWVGVVPMLMCVGIIVMQHGHLYDLEKKTYRHYYQLLNFKFGQTINIEKADAIIVSKEIIKEKSSTSWSGTAIKTKVKLWQVTLKHNNDELFVTETEDIKEACTSVLIFMAYFKIKAYSKKVSSNRALNYDALRKGIIMFGDTVFIK